MDLKMKERKQRIIDNSLDIFVRKGFEGTTTSEICKQTRINPGALFYLFDNKESLIHELYVYSKKEIRSNVLLNYNSNNFSNVILKIWENIITFGLDNYNIVRYVFLYYYSSFYTNRIIDSESTREKEYFKRFFDGDSVNLNLDSVSNYLTIYVLHSACIVIDQLKKHPENKDIQIDKARKIFWNGIQILDSRKC